MKPGNSSFLSLFADWRTNLILALFCSFEPSLTYSFASEHREPVLLSMFGVRLRMDSAAFPQYTLAANGYRMAVALFP
jgi:hypothetical protein